MKQVTFFAAFILLFSFSSTAQHKKITKQEYIATYKDFAIQDMIESGVPASITLAQAILESSSGNSKLATKAKNHFGIKCHSSWNGPSIKMDDDEKNECFRKYKTVLDSYRDHSKFLTTRGRYDFLFEYEITDYKKWSHGLKKAGYATNPKYGHLLIKIIEENELYDLDKLGQNYYAHNNSNKSKTKKGRTVTSIKKSKPVNVPNTTPSKIKISADRNNVPYVMSHAGDTWLSIATRNDMMLWQVLKYNDAEKYTPVYPNSVIYIKPKR
ncbi:MAG: hypothetical protein HKN75_01130, partial [Bacteroidia bacterium]|nr:hypothetical protein [Bacteroidia bacterium]